MLIEIPAATLLDKTPEEMVCHVLSMCLKTTPPRAFLARHAIEIQADDLGFVERYLAQWPNVFRSKIQKPQRGIDAMRSVENIISNQFFMSVPSEHFLDVVYHEFFGRGLDETERLQYDDRNFDTPAAREAIVTTLAASPEFARFAELRVLAAPPGPEERVGAANAQALYWDQRPAMPPEWYADGPMTNVLSSHFMPFVLWNDDRQRLYSLPGVHLLGELELNSLTAPPEWVLWGPKAPLSPGHYRISIVIDGEPDDLFIFDAVSNVGSIVYTCFRYFGSISLNVAINVDKPAQDFELRLFNFTGRPARLRLNELSLVRC